SYKIAREVESASGNRFDLILIINGLPLINIEQKRADKSLEEAYNQFKRYYADGEYVNKFMTFSQMLVMNSVVATIYFATTKQNKNNHINYLNNHIINLNVITLTVSM